jgi:anti-anti-sigma factor
MIHAHARRGAGTETSQARLQIIERIAGRDTVLKLSGELDIAASSDIVRAVRHALRRQPRNVVVDLHDVAFIDLTGTRALIRCRRLAVAKESEMILARPSAAVQRMLVVSGLHAVFDVQHDAGSRPTPQQIG